jgi:hypothetical protein
MLTYVRVWGKTQCREQRCMWGCVLRRNDCCHCHTCMLCLVGSWGRAKSHSISGLADDRLPLQMTGETNSCWLVTGKYTKCNHDNLTPTWWGTVDAAAPALTRGACPQLRYPPAITPGLTIKGVSSGVSVKMLPQPPTRHNPGYNTASPTP